MSKRIPPPCPEPETGRAYWRSLDHLAETPEFREWTEREFPDGASELKDPVSRRHFMQIMSASFLLAGVGLTGCRRPEERIVPFTKMPEGYVHGVPQQFATSMPMRGSAIPLVAKSHEGRPVKVEGNAEHPINQREGRAWKHAGTDLHAQASILGLYDPDRSQRFALKGQSSTREKLLDFLTQTARQFEGTQGKGLAFLVEQCSSPTRARLQKLLAARYPQARWCVYEPLDFHGARRAASLLFGQPVRPVPHLDQASRIVALDCDFIGSEEDSYQLIRDFAAGRKTAGPADEMSRLYVAESLMTLTGSGADHRLRLPSSQIFPLTCLLFAEFIELSGAKDQNAEAGPFAASLSQVAANLPAAAVTWAKACIKDLLAHNGRVTFLAGYRQPLEVHLLAQALNFYLGREGGAVSYQTVESETSVGIAELATALNAGEVETLFIAGGNPVYSAPADLDWAKTQRRAGNVVRLGYFEDETSAVADWHVPLAHFLESWGDARTGDGTWVPVQPLIGPLFNGLTEIELLGRLADLPLTKPYDLVRETVMEAAGAGAVEDVWKRFLHDGFLAGSKRAAATVEIDWAAAGPVVLESKAAEAPSLQRLEVVFARAHSVDDGRYVNNGWLQELPDPITKITWDNVIQISPATAAELKIEVVDWNRNVLRVPLVSLEVEGRTIKGPVWIQPGLADHVVGVTLGYGRTPQFAGRVGGNTGYNAYPLRTTKALHIAGGARLIESQETYPLSCTQNHWFMQGRPIVREANLEEYRKNPRFARAMNTEEPPGGGPLYPNPLAVAGLDATHQWGMSIDLSACVGCASCTIACQSENNIPIVGKDQVNRHREMHWIRIDRYFTGPISDPQVINQPMLCQHCEAAPCESVCPVNATVHDNEGLNVMAYNRCVGTRYCSNNCPYKVRRFNFFDYNRRALSQLKGPFYSSPLVSTTDGEWTLKRWFKDRDRGVRPQDEWDLLKLAKNPDVTVRMRGVMEKCTFCLQRIEQAKIAQKVKAGASGAVEVADGTFQTACQQACPAEAIAFGNIRDSHSRVAQAKANDRTYLVLDYLDTKPRVTYLARVRNPNPDMPDHQPMPYSTDEFLKGGGMMQNHDAGAGAHSAGHEAAGQKGAH